MTEMKSTPGAERVLRAEKVKRGMWGGKGWLTLTNTRLVFSGSEDLDQGVLWSVALDCVESVRAKKAFRAGTEILDVYHRDGDGVRQHETFERTSLAAWANAASSFGTHRAEPNSFQGFETQIIQAREALVTTPTVSAASVQEDFTVRLERLAQLHRSGSLSNEEFAAAKAKLLAED